MESKVCTKCLKLLPFSSFYWNKTRKQFKSRCRKCQNNDPKKRARNAAWRAKSKSNPQYRLRERDRQMAGRPKWSRMKNSTYLRDETRRTVSASKQDHWRAHYNRNKLAKNFASAVRKRLKDPSSKKGRSAFSLVGYTVHELRAHLERQFTGKMSWENYGTYWHIDHIVPVSSFDLSTPDAPDFTACWALTNLRPLEKHKNIQKRAKRLHLI